MFQKTLFGPFFCVVVQRVVRRFAFFFAILCAVGATASKEVLKVLRRTKARVVRCVTLSQHLLPGSIASTLGQGRVPDTIPMSLEVNVQVYCKLQGLWERGRVVDVEPECQVELQDGRLISPSDLQTRRHILRMPRYPVGAYVHCKMGGGRWAAGRVVSHSFEEPGHPSAKIYPYQVKLKQGGLLIYV